ncbi:MAG: substrate-binding domain-containing protein, partial [Nitrospirales bacterium]|nr:substrate-binding domain-containing protein [Nitrospirales bacterium]
MGSPVHGADTLTVYSGRAERLIKPVLDMFQQKTGISIRMLTSGSTELLNRLQAEGKRTPADVFITNEAGTLERARELHLLHPLNMNEVEPTIPSPFRAPDNSWIG